MPAIALAYVEVLPDTAKFAALVESAMKTIRNPMVSFSADIRQVQAAIGRITEPVAVEVRAVVDSIEAMSKLDQLDDIRQAPFVAALDVGKVPTELAEFEKARTARIGAVLDAGNTRPELESFVGPWFAKVIASLDLGNVKPELESLRQPIEVPVVPKMDDSFMSSFTGAGKSAGDGFGSGASAALVGFGSKLLPALGLGLIAKEIADVGGAMDTSVARINVNLQLTGEAAEENSKKLRTLFQTMGADAQLGAVSMADAAAGYEMLVKGALSGEEATAALRGALQLSIVTQQDAGTAAKSLTDIMATFGISAKDVGKSIDLVAQSEILGKGTTQDLIETMKVGGTTWNTMFKDASPLDRLKDFSAASLVFDSAGIRGSHAGELIKRSMLDMTGVTDSARKGIVKMTDAAEKMGIKIEGGGDIFRDAAGKMRPLEESLGTLRDLQTKMPAREFQTMMQEVFTTVGLDGATKLGDGLAAMDKFREGLDVTGAATRMAEANAAGYKGAIDAIGGAFETVLASLAQLAAPIAVPGLQAIAGVLGDVSGALSTFLNLKGAGLGFLDSLDGAFGSLFSTTKYVGSEMITTKTKTGNSSRLWMVSP